MKKVYLLLAFLFSLGVSLTASSPEPQVNIQISAKYIPDSKALHVNWQMHLRYDGTDTLSQIFIHFGAMAFAYKSSAFGQDQLHQGKSAYYFADRNNLAKISALDFVQNGSDTLSISFFNRNPDLIALTLNHDLHKDSPVKLSCEYILTLPSLFFQLGYHDKEAYFAHWFPMLAPYNNNHWHLQALTERIQPARQAAQLDISLQIPKAFSFLSAQEVKTNSEENVHSYQYKGSNELDFIWFISEDKTICSDTISTGRQQTIVKTWTHPEEACLHCEVPDEGLLSLLPHVSNKIIMIPVPENHVIASAPAVVYVPQSRHPNLKCSDFHTHWMRALSNYDTYASKWPPYIKEGIHQVFIPKEPIKLVQTNPIFRWIFSEPGIPLATHAASMERAAGRPKSAVEIPAHYNAWTYHIFVRQYAEASWRNAALLVGRDKLAHCLASIIGNGSMSISTDTLQTQLESCTGHKLSFLFQDGPALSDAIDIGIRPSSNNWQYYNKSQIAIPARIEYFSAGQLLNAEPLLLLPGEHFFEPLNSEADSVQLNVGELIHQNNRKNHHWKKKNGEWDNSAHLTLNFLTDFSNQKNKQRFITPMAGINTHDGYMIGLSLHNISIPPEDLEWHLTPMYGLFNGEIVGLADLGYYFKMPNLPGRFRIGLSTRTFHYFTPQLIEDTYRMYRLLPSLSWQLNPKNKPNIEHRIKLRSIHLWEQGLLSDPTAPDVRFVAYQASWIKELRYSQINRSLLSPGTWTLAIEQQSYDTPRRPEHYLKIWSEWLKQLYFDTNKSFHIRAFAGSFLINTHRQLGFISPGLGRGNFSLFGNSALDYRYDEFFMGRNMSSGLGEQQVSISDGGFKNAFTPAFSDGITNNFLFSLNLKTDMPQLPDFLPLRPYFDIGYTAGFERGSAQSPFDPNFFWSGGLEFSFANEQLFIYIPLVNSANIQRFYGELGSVWRRISFSWTLNRKTPGEMARGM